MLRYVGANEKEGEEKGLRRRRIKMPDSYEKFLDLENNISDDAINAFKRVFLSADGQFVLGKILEKCKFMEPCENKSDMALNNFAKELMATIYWDQKKKGLNIHRIIRFVREKLRSKK